MEYVYIYIYAHTCILYFRSGISINEISKGFKTYVIHDKRVILKANGSAETQPTVDAIVQQWLVAGFIPTLRLSAGIISNMAENKG